MRQPVMIQIAATALLAGLLVAPFGGPSMGEDVGVTAATNPVATGEPPGQGVRELRIGLNVVRNERIRTTAAGSTLVIFVDKTSLTIGPNSDITIDQYVYNPGASSGNLAVRIGRGVLRFIGGEISHSDQIQITTPTATLGIRGGMALVDTTHERTGIVNLYGTTTVTTPLNSVTLSSAGSYAETSGGRVSDPIAVPLSLLARLNAQLESKRGQTGGAPPGLVTSETLRQIVTDNGPSHNPPEQQLSEQQLQFIVSVRPQLESISTSSTQSTGGNGGTGGNGNKCASDPDDCDIDHHHRHDHDRHDHDHDHHHEDHVGVEHRNANPTDPNVGRSGIDDHGPIRGGPLGLHGHDLPDHIGPNPTQGGIPRHP